MLIGRKREREQLLGHYRADKSDFVVVYGRRRVGKTFLVRELFANDLFLFYTGTTKIRTTAGNLERFADALGQYGIPVDEVPASWMKAFDLLRDRIKASRSKGKKVIFIDEMPWLDLPRSGFLAALEYFWNSFASARRDILLIACGSASSWITRKLLRDHGGLHNRVTGRVHLQPLTLDESEAYLAAKGSGLSRYDLIESYMVFGGIPYYLDYFDNRYSLATNIDRIVFDQDAPLRDEFNELYASLFKNSSDYIRVVRALGEKRKGLTRNEIIETSSLSNGGMLSDILENLELSGFIRSYYAYPQKTNGMLYQLIDGFSLFDCAFLHPARPTNRHFWSNQTNTPKLNSWRGYAFEIVCLWHIDQIEQGLGIWGVNTAVSSWKSRGVGPGAQIDLVIDREDRVVNLCEMKYTRNEFELTAKDEDVLRNKIAAFTRETGIKKAIFLTLVSPYGVKHGKHTGIVRAQITMDDLFAPTRK
jgi:AAA+ ATPase superfamily predicted ATPase